ncbi:armadillo-type protein [Gloeopeniophorella convolvens]|nr:armadillo-type protein [Gloeopeniophorella convolvens]
MPKELRKRGKRKKAVNEEHAHIAQDQEPEVEEEQQSGPSWIVPRAEKEVNPEAPFGYVDAEVKAYFRTVDDQLKEWQENWEPAETDEDVDPNENRRMFLMAALQEISGKERELATDPDCAGGLERMAYSMDDFVRRVFMDSLTGSYEQLIRHRFASHVVQTLLTVAADTIARESRGVLPKVDGAEDRGQLRTLTQQILDFSEEILPSLPALIMDPFASHVVRELFVLLCPQLFHADAPHKSQAFVRSRKSAAWKAKQGPLRSIFGKDADTEKGKASANGGAPAFRVVAQRYVLALRERMGANEVRSLAANKVACPVLQMLLEIEADQGLSDEPGSLMDHVLVGLITTYHNDPSATPEASDYLSTLLRDPTSSHLLETLVSRCPEHIFSMLWPTYFERNLKKLAMHPVANFVVAKALERANTDNLSFVLNELRESLGKIRQTRVGVLRALIERAANLNSLEAEVCEAVCFAFEVESEEDRKMFIHCALSLKGISEYTAALKAKTVAPPGSEPPEASPKKHSRKPRETAADSVEPTTPGALLAQSLLRLSAPHNTLVLDSIEALPSDELVALTHHPAASRVIDALLEGAQTPPRARRALLRALEARFADVVDDRVGARVGERCWAIADAYFKEKLARALLPHAARLAAAPHARFFVRGLALPLLQRRPEEWRRLHATPSVLAAAPAKRADPAEVPPPAETEKKEKKRKTETERDGKKRKRGDEIDALFDGALGRKVARGALAPAPRGGVPVEEAEVEVERVVVAAIQAAPKGAGASEGKRKKTKR